MTLIRTSVLNGIAVLIRMLAMLGINKILAVFVGPTGYAAIGQFQNAIQMVTMFASGAINTGVTKYTAEYGEDIDKQRALWMTAGTIVLVGTLTSSVVIALLSDRLAAYFLKAEGQSSVFIWFAVNLIAFTGNAFLLAILNGRQEIPRYVLANICGSLFAFIVVALMTVKLGLYGALVSLAIYQSLPFFATLIVCSRAPWFRVSYLYGRIDRRIALNLLRYAAMAITAAVCGPLSQILIRGHLTKTLGVAQAGYWEALTRMSGAYLLFVTTTLSVYYLPKLSRISNIKDLKDEILQGYKVILPVAAVMGVAIFLLRDVIIALLFSRAFYPVRDLVALQTVGDTLKIGSWILSYLMLSKALTRAFIITEIGFALSYVGMSILFINEFGLIGSVISYVVNYAIYWVVMFFITRGLVFRGDDV